jgi:O-antigen/teichoic acid export membrane protein
LLIGAIGAGIYSPALTVINTTFLVPTAVWYVVVPLAARQRAHRASFLRLLLLLLAASVLFGMICALVFAIGAVPLIAFVFGPQYRAAVPLLQIMAVVPLLKSVNFCWALVLVVHDAQRARARVLAASTAFNIVVNVLALPVFGVVGAAWVNVASETLLVGGYGYMAWRTLRHQES